MKITQALRNIRKAATKRVKTVTDDYGNRVHIVNKKSGKTIQRNAGGIYGKKKMMNTAKRGRYPNKDSSTAGLFPTKTGLRHYQSNERRSLLKDSSQSTKNEIKTNPKKRLYHEYRMKGLQDTRSLRGDLYNAEKATNAAKEIHGERRKSKDFTKK